MPTVVLEVVAVAIPIWPRLPLVLLLPAAAAVEWGEEEEERQ